MACACALGVGTAGSGRTGVNKRTGIVAISRSPLLPPTGKQGGITVEAVDATKDRLNEGVDERKARVSMMCVHVHVSDVLVTAHVCPCPLCVNALSLFVVTPGGARVAPRPLLVDKWPISNHEKIGNAGPDGGGNGGKCRRSEGRPSFDDEHLEGLREQFAHQGRGGECAPSDERFVGHVEEDAEVGRVDDGSPEALDEPLALVDAQEQVGRGNITRGDERTRMCSGWRVSGGRAEGERRAWGGRRADGERRSTRSKVRNESE